MAIATEDSTSLEIRRVYRVSPTTLYAAWTDPTQLKEWMGPSNDISELEIELDLRVGGRYRCSWRAADGERFCVSGVYREVVPNRRLVYTWAWQSTPERESLVTVEFAAAGDGAELVLMHRRFADTSARDRHRQGWSATIARLDQFLARHS